jgi:hypothetical protein
MELLEKLDMYLGIWGIPIMGIPIWIWVILICVAIVKEYREHKMQANAPNAAERAAAWEEFEREEEAHKEKAREASIAALRAELEAFERAVPDRKAREEAVSKATAQMARNDAGRTTAQAMREARERWPFRKR